MAGSFYYQLQQCGTINTAVGSSAFAQTIGGVFYDTIGLICWEIIGTDLGPSYTIDIDTLLGVTDCNDPLCNSVTPSPTPTLSLTPSPCSCGEYTYVVDANDILNATGNTNGYNGIVFWEYTDCNGNFVQDQFGSAGSHTQCLCVNLATYYWQNDAQQATVNLPSYNGPCLIPTDTPTPTPTETPTQTLTETPTQTLTETPTQTPTETPTQTPTETPTQTPTETPTQTPTETPTQTPTETPTNTPTQTSTSTPNGTPTNTPTPTQTPTALVDCSSCIGTGWTPYDSCNCYRENVTGSTAPTTTIPLIPRSAVEYSQLGTRFYDTGYTTGGTGTILTTSFTAPLWFNSPNNTTNGPMNRCAIWYSAFTITNTWLGFSTCLTGISQTNTYYVGIAADNEFRLVLDGVQILNTIGSSMAPQDKFKFWNVYPVTIPSGDHTLELYGLDYGVIAGFGMEIYNNTLDELTGATTINDIDIIFSSSGYTTADIVQDLSGNYLSSGFTCPANYVYSTCSGTCVQYEFCDVCITPTPTQTPSETPTNTPTETPTPTPSATIGSSPVPTDTPTQTPTETPTETPTNTPTETPTNTPTETPTNTPTTTETPPSTPTPTVTPTINLISFQDCVSGTFFRFEDLPVTVVLGDVYYITGSTEYEGCATVVSSGGGPIYNGVSVTFTNVTGCGDDLCPTVGSRAALLTDCSDESVFYALVDEDTAFVGGVYEYNGRCYSFVEFSGPGGPDLGSPDWGDCVSCLNNTPTPTPNQTPTPTPTVSSTPLPCGNGEFCFTTTLPSLSDYNGQYTSGSTYNGRLSYSGGSIATGVIYYFTSATESYWCLSTSLGGTCLLRGSSPCYSACPDISFGSFVSGVCPTPTPTPIDCDTFDFNAYFDCDWEPVPTPSPSVDCDDVNFNMTSLPVTPTPTPSGNFCVGKSVSFTISYVPDVTPTPTKTPTVTLTRTVPASGQVTFNIFEETFSCVSVKVLNKCGTDIYYYTSDPITYEGTPIQIGMVFSAFINGEIVCVKYEKDDSNLSSNTNVDVVVNIFGNDCEYCSTVPSPTPTSSSTPTQTPQVTTTATQTQTPSVTPTNTATPTPSVTIGLTPTATPRPSYTPTTTPSLTPTNTPTTTSTPTVTPTPSVTPNFVYVYSSCSAIAPNVYPTYMIQTVQSPIQTTVGFQFKDNQGNCWTYEGAFGTNYIAPPLTVSQTYSGDYFAGIPSITFTACTDCQAIIIPPCSLIYFNATVCGTNNSIVVSACDLGPCQQITFGGGFFGLPGGVSGQFCLTPQVGDNVSVRNVNGGDDICVTLNSLTTSQTTPYNVVSPTYAAYPVCGCSLYRTYKANSCDGLNLNVAIFDSVSSQILSGGTIVSTNTGCFTIVSYDGIKDTYPVLPGITPIVSSTHTSCSECLNPQPQNNTIFCDIAGNCVEVSLSPGAVSCSDMGLNDC